MKNLQVRSILPSTSSTAFTHVDKMESLQDMLSESDERYHALFNLVPIAIYCCETSGMIESFNTRAAELWGRSPKLGDTDEKFCGAFKLYNIDGSFMPHDQNPMALSLSGEIPGVKDAEVIIERPNGSRVTVIVNVRPLKNREGVITGAINCFYDISERKQIEARLLKQADSLQNNDRNKDEFLAMLAHELRNPLVPIRNALKILKSDNIEIEEKTKKELQDIMDRQLIKVVRLVDDLLDVSRITRRVIVLKEDILNLGLILRQSVESVRTNFEECQHTIFISIPKEEVIVKGDPVRLDQIISNLLINACKYTTPGGHITVTLRHEGSYAIIKVTDNGIGISAELLPNIFNLFVQAERSPDRKQDGLGIGLTLVRNLVELHGGTVEAESPGLKMGSTFTVRLPVLNAKEENVSDAPLIHPIKIQPLKRRILVIEDNVDSARTTQLLLEFQGHTVEVAFNGQAGIDIAKTFKPDVILLDIGLPVMDGYEVARRLRALPETESTKLIALSGYGQPEDRRKSKEAGFNHHLLKPASMEQLQTLMALEIKP